MNKADIAALTWLMHELDKEQTRLVLQQISGNGGKAPQSEIMDSIKLRLAQAEVLFNALKLRECLRAVDTAKHSLGKVLVDNSTAKTIVNRLLGDILEKVDRQTFLIICIAPDCLDTELSVFMQRLRMQGVAGEPGLA